MGATIQIRRGTAAQWAAAPVPLAEGEPGIATDTNILKIGDGTSLWAALPAVAWNPEISALTMVAGTDPGASAAGRLTLYSKALAGRIMPKIVGPSGLDTALQPLLARNKIGMFTPPGNATTAAVLGAYTAPTAIGTATARNVATANMFTRMRRIGYVSAATAGALCGARAPSTQVTTGGAGGGSGFFKIMRFGISDAVVVSGARMFVGVTASVSAPTNVEPSTLTNCIGVGCRTADTTLQLFHGGTAAQLPIDLGANFPVDTTTTDVYELALFAPPDTSDVHWEVTRLNTGDAVSGTILSAGGVASPAGTTLLSYLMAWRTNNTTAAAVGLDIMSDYIETDY